MFENLSSKIEKALHTLKGKGSITDINVAETSLKEALNSGLFLALRDNGHLLEDHAGGCVLYEKRALVEELLNGQIPKN